MKLEEILKTPIFGYNKDAAEKKIAWRIAEDMATSQSRFSDMIEGQMKKAFLGDCASPLPRDLWCPSCEGKGYLNPNGADETAKPNTPCTTCARTGRAPIPFSELWGRNVPRLGGS